MKGTTISLIEGIFERFPILKAPSPGTQKDILELEAYAGFSLPDDYKEFILKYGAGVVGPYRVYGIGKAKVMTEEEISAVNMTRVFREDQWDGTEDWLVFSMDHAGNPVGMDRYGVVWISDHDFGGVTKLFDSFEKYLRHTCLEVE